MTWTWESFMGGETRDPLIEGWYDAGAGSSGLWLQNTAACTRCSIVTSPVKNGTGAIRVGTGGIDWGQILYLLSTAPTGKLKMVQTWICLPNAPSVAFPCFYDSTTGAVCAQVGTDGRVRFVKYTAGVVTTSSQWSVSALPIDNATFAHVCWVIDPITLGSSHVWHTLYINGIPEIMWDSGAEPSYGAAWLMAVTSDGTDNTLLYVDDLCAAVSSDANDAPHITAPPIGKISAQHPTAAGDNADWTLFPNTGERADQDWDDATGNDADSTYLKVVTTGLHQDSHMEDADTLGWGAGAAPLHNPIYSLVHRMVSGIGSKWSAFTLCDLVTAITLTAPGYSYGGYGRSFTRSSGSWGRDDLGTMSVGGQTSATGMDREWRITTLMLQWLFTDSSLVKAPAPMIPQGGMF